MPQLTPDQEDSIFEAISKQLFRINSVVKGMFGQDMTDEEKLRAYHRVSQGVNQAMQQQDGVVDPNAMVPDEAGSRNAMFKSNVPMSRAIGPTRPVDQIPNNETGFSGANPLISDPNYLRAIAQSRIGQT